MIVSAFKELSHGVGARATFNTAPPDTRRRPETVAVVASFREAGVEPHGPAPEAYAAVEVWGQAVRRAGTTAPPP